MAMNPSLAEPRQFDVAATVRGGRTTDPLRPARGIMLGCAIGAALWGGIIAAFVA